MRISRVMLFAVTTIIAVAIGLVTITLIVGKGPTKGGSIGVPTIGGAFKLIDHKGKEALDTDFHGKYLLVMFGFTFCPDICPTELQVISETMERLGDLADKIQPIMITVDPERDTVAVLADYISNFDPSLIALTGKINQIRLVAKSYHVFFAKTPTDDEGDYFIDHSAFIYLMGLDGKYLHHFPPQITSQKMTEKVLELISDK